LKREKNLPGCRKIKLFPMVEDLKQTVLEALKSSDKPLKSTEIAEKKGFESPKNWFPHQRTQNRRTQKLLLLSCGIALFS
jgi:hypothetical protein